MNNWHIRRILFFPKEFFFYFQITNLQNTFRFDQNGIFEELSTFWADKNLYDIHIHHIQNLQTINNTSHINNTTSKRVNQKWNASHIYWFENGFMCGSGTEMKNHQILTCIYTFIRWVYPGEGERESAT